jgi:hypothetical protein
MEMALTTEPPRKRQDVDRSTKHKSYTESALEKAVGWVWSKEYSACKLYIAGIFVAWNRG